MLGSIFSPPPASGSTATPIDTATNATGSLMLPFTSVGVPPTGVSAMLIRETAIPGDLFRSGPLGAYPTPPTGTLTLITPPAAVMIPTATLNTAAAAGLPVTFGVPGDAQALTAIATAGLIIPLSLTIATITLTTAAVAPRITVTITGTMVAQQGYFWTITHAFTLVVGLTAVPSADPGNPSRVLSITMASSTLTATGIPGFVSAIAAPGIGSAIASFLESAVNGTIMSSVPGALADSGMMLTPTARISALRLTITASGISLVPVLGDLFGPAVVPIPATLSVSISPTPEPAVQHSYVVTVTNSANGAPVAGVTLALHNYTTQTPQTMVSTTKTSDAQGHATFTSTLHFKKQRIVHGAGDSEIILISPTLSVSHSGFSTVEIVLLEELS